MSDRRGLAVRAVALAVLRKRVVAEETRVKEHLAAELMAGERVVAALDSATTVGSVIYSKGLTTAHVTDERALLNWVRDNHPDEVVEQVRGSFIAALLANAKTAGVAVDVRTGEPIPGVDVTTGDPYLSVRPDKKNEPALIDAIRANQDLALSGDVEDEQ